MGRLSTSAVCLVMALIGAISPISAQSDCNRTLDVVFVLDGSNSLGPFNFATMTTTVRGVLSTLSVLEGQTRAGLVIFGTSDTLRVIPLTVDESFFIANLETMKSWPDGTTDTTIALQRAKTELMTSDRNDVTKVMVVMTDGYSNNDVTATTEDIKSNGIQIISVGAGYYRNDAALSAMASQYPEDVIDLSETDRLSQRLGQLPNVICPEVCTQGIDLMLVLDGSNSVTFPSFNETLYAIRDTVRDFWHSYPNSSIGLLVFASDIKMSDIIDPTTDPTAFDNVIHIEHPDSGTATAPALREATRRLLANQRPGMSRAIVVITDGRSDNTTDTIAAANEAREQNITVNAIGVGPDVDKRELRQIGNFEMVVNYTILSAQLTPLLARVCYSGSGISNPAPPVVNGVCNKTLDVMFLVDASNDVSNTSFSMMTSAVSQAAKYYVTAGKNSRVGVLTYPGLNGIPLNSDPSIYRAIPGVLHQTSSGSRLLAPALNEVTDGILTSGGRAAPFVVIVLVGGPIVDYTAASGFAQLLVQQSGGSIYVLEITSAVNNFQTQALVGGMNNRIYHADTYNQVDTTLLNMAADVCREA